VGKGAGPARVGSRLPYTGEWAAQEIAAAGVREYGGERRRYSQERAGRERENSRDTPKVYMFTLAA
jgi:hypothetical protein